MARIAGVDLPREKRIEVGLTYIYGIGRPSANKILEKANINRDTKVNQLSEAEVVRLRNIIEQEFKVEGDLRRDVATDINHCGMCNNACNAGECCCDSTCKQ